MKNRSFLQIILFLFFVSLSAVNPAYAAISNGMDALNVLGQNSDDPVNIGPAFEKGKDNDGPNRRGGIRGAAPMALDPVRHRMFIADAGNRVVVHMLNPDNSFIDHVPDAVLGQPDFTTVPYTTFTVTQWSISHTIAGMAYDPVDDRLFVADVQMGRIMVFDTSTIDNREDATHVLGQADFSTYTGIGGIGSPGAPANASNLQDPKGMVYDSVHKRLFVAMPGYGVNGYSMRRVLVFDMTPGNVVNNMPAIHVLGQPDFTSAALVPGASIATMLDVYGLALDQDEMRLFVSDRNYNRVLVFSVDPSQISNGMNASHVLGQPNFTTTTAALAVNKLTNPHGIVYDHAQKRLFVSETGIANAGQGRVKVWDLSAGITDGMDAAFILGNTSYTAVDAMPPAARMPSPISMEYDAGRQHLYVSDSILSRILEFDVATIVNGEDAVAVHGQTTGDHLGTPTPLFDRFGDFNGPDVYGYASPQAVLLDTTHHRLFIADTNNNRVLMYELDDDNELLDRIPDVVLGQPSFIESAAVASAEGLNQPAALAFDPLRNMLFIAEAGHHRVLVYDASSLTSGQSALYVIGQPDFTTITSGTTTQKINQPRGLAYDALNQRLYVSQVGSNRVTVYDMATYTTNPVAAYVIGQPDFTTATTGNTTQKMNQPRGIALNSDATRLFVPQSGNHRVTVYDISTLANNPAAIAILGQPDFATTSQGTTISKMSQPASVIVDDVHNRLFVGQAGVRRVTVYDIATITDGEDAVNVLGQLDFTSNANNIVRRATGTPRGMGFDPVTQRLYMADSSYHRVPVFDVAPPVPGLQVAESDGNTEIEEGGTQDTIDVSLTLQPASDVVVQIALSQAGIATTDVTTLTFTSANWATPQTVTVSALQDDNAVSETLDLIFSIDQLLSDPAYHVVADVVVSIAVHDDDTAGVQITETGGSTLVVENGATDTFEVVLTAQPSNDVTILVQSADSTIVQATPAALTFSPLNWNVAQTVTLTAPVDTNTVDDTVLVTVAIDIATSAVEFQGVNAQNISVQITDAGAPATPPSAVYSSGGGGGFSAPYSALPVGAESQNATNNQQNEQNDASASSSEPTDGTQKPEKPLIPDMSFDDPMQVLEKIQKQCALTIPFQTSHESISRAFFVEMLVRCHTGDVSGIEVRYPVFSDIAQSDHRAQFISYLKEAGIVHGYPDGTFRPDAFITRVEALKILMRLYFPTDSSFVGDLPFDDVDTDQWYAQYVYNAYIRGIVRGYMDKDGTLLRIFGVKDALATIDTARLLIRSFGE